MPRPTLYRYLKEYPIPYARRSGRIRIPEDALDGIRRVRALHDEGLGTEAVRRRLRDDESELEGRLDRISETLEELRRGTGGHHSDALALASGDVRTLLARQTLLISAVFDMSEMLEELLASTGRPRRSTFEDTLRQELPGAIDTHTRGLPPATAPGGRMLDGPTPDRLGGFGALSQRRRRAALAGALLVVLALAVLIVGSQLA